MHNTPSSTKRLLSTAAALLFVATANIEAATPTQPKLVVGIMVEDLRGDYINLLREHFTQGGFNKLINDGVVLSNVDYGSPVDAAAATAIIFTGASPQINGIPSQDVFDRSSRRTTHIMHDETALGKFTSQTLSPKAVNTTTIADEVRIAGGGVTYAYSIAPDPAQAIIMAGHAGNAAMWIDESKLDWASTTYYRETPPSMSSRNRFAPLHNRIDTMVWVPVYNPQSYSLLPTHTANYPFKYVLRQKGADKATAFLTSPKVNAEVTTIAIDQIKTLQLGTHDGPDMLSIAYTAEPYEFPRMTDSRYEIYDTYYRLDLEIETLIKAIDENVGLNNTLIFLAATPASQRTRRDDDKWSIPYGEFSTRKAISLLNLYLIAIYGNGEWVIGYHNNEFFLNQKLIADRGLDLRKVRTEAANFLQRMSGVTRAFSLDDIIDGRSSDTAALRQSTVLNYAGDVRVSVMPGWQIIDDFNKLDSKTEKVVRATSATAPVMILAPNVPANKIDATVDARAIAPTVTSLLRIRSPNAASEHPLNLE